MTWHAKLQIDYRLEHHSTLVRHKHHGPLRILQSLYPEGADICHNVLVHPPGGLVGGDTLEVDIRANGRAHGLLTTPGASRFYRATGNLAVQTTRIVLADQARLEWLPLETIAYNHCLAENRLQLDLAAEAECLAWDITALGLPQAGLPFLQGHYLQHIEIPGVWLERGLIDAQDPLLMDGATGLAGRRCLASLFFASGSALTRQRRDTGLALARQLIADHDLQCLAGATCPNPQVMVVRVLSDLVEPAMNLLRQIRAAWRLHYWQLAPSQPRIWST